MSVFEQWVSDQVNSELYAEVLTDQDEAAFWITSFVNYLRSIELEYADHDDDDIIDGICLNIALTEFFDD